MSQEQVRRIVGELDQTSSLVVRAIALEVEAELTENTPVDTGWARANWIPSVGTSPLNQPAPRESDSNIGAALSRQNLGLASVLGYNVSQGSVFVTNNVPYIVSLNNGSSTQAPRAFVEASIDIAVSRVQGTRRFL